ncbi:TonB family protein [Longimicrobium sp.]|uniref:TonB family protein n=1 Tax=Longimicrobium sp. TaxID=2029185 RepID=UPI002C4687F2|nr:TonB family protein [Longimicrobium sp.]HSU14278.1 TonB family protein [Longimicrobium sp.]
MFNVVTDRRKRSVWTPRTVALSAGAHLLLLGVFVTAAESTPAKPAPPGVIEFPIGDEPRPEPKPVTPQPRPDEPQPKKGDFVSPKPPPAVPDGVTKPDPDDTPLHDADVRGLGIEGDVIGKPDPAGPATTTTTTTGPTEVFPYFGGGDDVIEAKDATVLPHLANERDAQRMLQRAYPPQLRDAGVSGQATVVVIIDRNGNVEPGSVRVQEASHPAFEEAARRAVERFHFTPAELNGQTVSVVIALPIHWELQH